MASSLYVHVGRRGAALSIDLSICMYTCACIHTHTISPRGRSAQRGKRSHSRARCTSTRACISHVDVPSSAGFGDGPARSTSRRVRAVPNVQGVPCRDRRVARTAVAGGGSGRWCGNGARGGGAGRCFLPTSGCNLAPSRLLIPIFLGGHCEWFPRPIGYGSKLMMPRRAQDAHSLHLAYTYIIV